MGQRNPARAAADPATPPAQARFHNRDQLGRLLQILVALQAGRFPSVGQLADLCEVSRRTIFRDLNTLLAAGFPVQFRPDRQGYELETAAFIVPPTLSVVEISALIVLARSNPGRDLLGLRSQADTALLKLIQAAVPSVRESTAAVFEALDEPGHDARAELSEERRAVYQSVVAALIERTQIRLWPRTGNGHPESGIRFSPDRLAFDTCWKISGRVAGSQRTRAFRLPDLARVEAIAAPISEPPVAVRDGRGRRPQAARARIRVGADAMERGIDRVANGRRRIVPAGDREIEVRFELAGGNDEECVAQILALGDRVEVLEPASLRRAVRRLALRVADRNGPERGVKPPNERRVVDRLRGGDTLES